MVFAVLILCAASFVIAWVATLAMKRVAPRLGFVDKPGHRKIHKAPTPLGGGVAIFLAFALPMLAVVIACHVVNFPADSLEAAYAGGVRKQTPVALALLGAMTVMHVMGLVDDRRALGPYLKLFVQLAVAAALVIPFKSLWSLPRWTSASAPAARWR